MFRTLTRTILCLGFCAAGTPAKAGGIDGIGQTPAPPPISAKPSAEEDPCAGFELTGIQGLRGTIISRVYPTQFSQGDQVTVCGRGLSMARFIENYQLKAGGPLQAGHFVEIGDETNKRGWRLQVFGLSSSANGDRVSFVAGGLFESIFQRSSAGITYFLVPAGRPGVRPTQNTTQGELKLVLGATQFGPPKVAGPVVTWSVGGPKPRHAYGRFFNKKESFVITSQGSEQLLWPDLGQITIEGGNLGGASYRIGEAPLKTLDAPGQDETSIIASVPRNAVAGEICAFGSGEKRCIGAIAVQPGPSVKALPPMPLQPRTRYTLEGTDLKPSVPGLTYRIVMSGLTGDEACAQVLKVHEHTAVKIEFSLGEVGDPSLIPETCSRAGNYQTPQENPSNLISLMARYKNQERPLYHVHYYLAQRKHD